MQTTKIELNEGINDTILFPSWIKTVYNDTSRNFAEQFNQVLLKKIHATNNLLDSFWKMNNQIPEINELKNFIVDEAEKVIEQYFGVIDEKYHRSNVYKIKMERCWLNLNIPGEGDTPHHHRGSAFSSVFYIKTHPKSGDLILLDPRTTSAMTTYVIEHKNGGIQTDRAYRRITPKTGTLLFFPSHLIHYVETNLSPYDRLCLACNFG
jgi:uncharacterized protein (TIGR02466 family)